MIKKIIYRLIKIIEKAFKKKIVIIDAKIISTNSTAALSKYGFWYAGNLYDTADISYGIATQGYVEKEETNLVIKILDALSRNQNISLYDIGANSGYYSILSSFLYKEKISVYSFEPMIEFADCIKKSIYLNRLNNVRVFEFGLGNKTEEKIMYLAGSGSTVEKGFSGENIKDERKIKLFTLDRALSKEDILLPDFIKIDVEGHELKVLQGGRNTILKSLPVLFIEIAYSMKDLGRSYINKDYKETFDFLRSIGYKTFKIENSILRQIDYTEKPDGVHMYLFLNTSKHAKLIDSYLINSKFE